MAKLQIGNTYVTIPDDATEEEIAQIEAEFAGTSGEAPAGKSAVTSPIGAVARAVPKGLVALGDVGIHLLSSAIAMPLAGSIAAAIGGADKSMETADKVFTQAADVLTVGPWTDTGKAVMEKTGEVMGAGLTKLRDVNAAIFGDNPALNTAAETVELGLPQLLSGGRLGRGMSERARLGPGTITDAEASALRLGVDLNNNTVRPTTVEAAERLTGGVRSRADTGIEGVQPAVRAMEDASQERVNALYTAARTKTAEIGYAPIREAVDKTFEVLRQRGVDIENSIYLQKRLQELRELDSRIPGLPGPEGARPGGDVSRVLGPDGKPFTAPPPRIPLNDLELINRRINTSIRAAKRSTDHYQEYGPLVELKKQINKMEDEQFINDMITGDPTAKAAWTKAKLANTAHQNRFHADKVIGTIVEKDMSATEVAKLVLGASESKHSVYAASTVKQLKEILGKDAPEIDALRSAVMVDFFDPIFKDTPGWAAGIERMRQIEKNSPQLLRELDISKADMVTMRRAMAAAKIAVIAGDFDKAAFITRFGVRMFAGHDIARRAMWVQTLNMIADRLLGIGQKTHKQLLTEYSGDVFSANPLISQMHPKASTILGNAAAVREAQVAYEERE